MRFLLSLAIFVGIVDLLAIVYYQAIVLGVVFIVVVSVFALTIAALWLPTRTTKNDGRR